MSIAAAEPSVALSKAAIFVTGSKGGPGKSTFSTLLVDYYRSRGITTAAYDGDHNNMTLLQFYGSRGQDGKLIESQDAVDGVKVFNVREPDERDLMLNVVERAATRIVIDLPGGGGEDVAAVLPDTTLFFQAFVDAGITPIVAIVMSNVKAAAASVPFLIDLFGPIPRYIAVKNRAFGSEFPAFDGIEVNGTRMHGGPRRVLEAAGGKIIEMPMVQKETYGRFDLASRPLAVAEADTVFMQMADRVRIKSWREQFAAALNGTDLAV